MSGTLPTDDLHQRADHEAGHLIAAHALGCNFHLHWITIESRITSGGSNGIGFYDQLPVEEHAQFCLAGLLAQAFGRIDRERIERVRRGDDPEDWSWFDDEFKRATKRALIQSHADMIMITSHPDFSKLDLAAAANATARLIRAHREDIWHVSQDLQRHTTMFGREALSSLAVAKEQSLFGGLAVDLYRKLRRQAEPPPQWTADSDEENPAGLYFEGFETWFGRDPLPRFVRKDNYAAWRARRMAD